MAKLKISNSALDSYSRCPRYYKFRYVENLKGDFTSTSLLFGSAIDQALNYILESLRDKKEWNKQQALDIFYVKTHEWTGANRLDYFKGDVPEITEGYANEEEAVFDNLLSRGEKLIDVYIKEVLPLIDEVVSVQDRGEILNEDEDRFVYVVDFIAKLKDGRTVLFDNKTASKKYVKKAVIQSQQLSLYIEQFPVKLAGYIVLIKNPAKEKGMTHQILIDEIPEETIAESFELLDKTMKNIKDEKFDCNYKGCRAYGKECEFSNACQYGNYEGLVPAKIIETEQELFDKKKKV